MIIYHQCHTESTLQSTRLEFYLECRIQFGTRLHSHCADNHQITVNKRYVISLTFHDPINAIQQYYNITHSENKRWTTPTRPIHTAPTDGNTSSVLSDQCVCYPCRSLSASFGACFHQLNELNRNWNIWEVTCCNLVTADALWIGYFIHASLLLFRILCDFLSTSKVAFILSFYHGLLMIWVHCGVLCNVRYGWLFI